MVDGDGEVIVLLHDDCPRVGLDGHCRDLRRVERRHVLDQRGEQLRVRRIRVAGGDDAEAILVVAEEREPLVGRV
eukprot:CAMPEP_0182579848 /NCGR_PEP_ID=MMETSP1324-20130603/45265_1 /TAXON_ID=236786 /ORGANISM="Florenciella sp., Strain RCC1587" /LENGTH=74 /DNA_ID=CAMNT_0024795999 /DNA_START=1 /DNA_END=222 /DNA_ORIENTATION=-